MTDDQTTFEDPAEFCLEGIYFRATVSVYNSLLLALVNSGEWTARRRAELALQTIRSCTVTRDIADVAATLAQCDVALTNKAAALIAAHNRGS